MQPLLSGNFARFMGFRMKTTSYVQAVKMAVAQAEKLGMDFYYDKWTMFMVNRPRLSAFREI